MADFDSLVAEADRARDRGDWLAAAAGYRTALGLDAGAGPIWVQLGHMLKEAGHFEAAGTAYREALERMPQDADLHLQMGHFLRRIGRRRDAAAYYEQAAALDPALGEATRHFADLADELVGEANR